MADSKDELVQQLTLMNKINAAMQLMANSSARVNDGYKKQLEAIQQVQAVVQTIVGGAGGTTFEQLAASISKVSGAVGDMNVAPMQQLIDQAGIAEGSIDALGETFMKAGKQAGFMSGFVVGLTKSFRGLIATSKATLGFLGGIVDWAFTVGAALLAIPLRILEGLMNLAAKSANGMNELRRQIEEVRKTFGDLGGPGAASIIVATKTLKGFADTGLRAWRVFGTLAERMQVVRETATAMGSTFSVLHDEFTDNAGAVLAYQKGLGVANEEMQSLGARAVTMGDSLTKTLHDISKQSLGLGKAFALDQKLIGREISKATKDVKHFGQVTVKEIGVAAVYARKLGIELEKITGTLDAFETFDQAAENSAKLSQAFGVQVDAFKLMEAQNPAEQIDMLRQQFKSAGVDASQFNRQQLKLLATSTGLDEATAKQVFSAKNYGVALNDVKKQAEASEKKGLSQAEAMSKLADSIERLVKDGPALQGSFFKMFIEGFLRGIQVSKPFMQLMRNIRQSLRTVMRIGVEFGRSFVKNFDGVSDALEGLAEMFNPARFSKLGRGLLNSFNDLLKGKIDVSKFMSNAFDGFASFIDGEGGPLKKVKEAFISFFKRVSQLSGPAIEWVGKAVGETMATLADYVSGKKKIPGVNLTGTKTVAEEIFAPLVKGISNAWPHLEKGIEKLFDAISDKVVKIVSSDKFKAVAKKIAVPLALALFGPAVIQGLIVAGIPLLFKGLLGIVAGSFKLLVASPAVLTAVGGFFKGLGGMITRGFASLGGVVTGGIRLLAAPMMTIGTALFASVNVSDAFDKFGADVTSRFGETNGKIGVGVAGLIDTVTLGLLPEKWIGSLASSVAEITGWMDEKLGKGMFSGVYGSIKEGAAKVFEYMDFVGKALSNISSVWSKVDFAGPIKQAMKGDTSIIDAYMGISENIGNAVFDATHKGAEKGIQAAAKKVTTKPNPTSTPQTPPVPGSVASSANQLGPKLPDVSVIENSDRLLSIQKTLESAQAAAKKIADDGPKLAKALAQGGIRTALEAVRETVGLVQELDDALNKAPTIDVSARLDKLTSATGIGKRAQYTVKSKDVVINLNLEVVLDVGKVERVMIMRKESIIRDRLNFATVSNPGSAGSQGVPDTYSERIPNITRR